MRDILPQKMILRQYVIGVITQVFEQFGYDLPEEFVEEQQALKKRLGHREQ